MATTKVFRSGNSLAVRVTEIGDRERVDVILTTPPGFRPYHFEEAVRQGKQIFMEKLDVDEEVAEIRWYSDNYVNYRLDYMHESRGSSRPMGFK